MSLYNEILVGRFNRALQKFLGMKGEPPSPQLANEIGVNFQFSIGNEFRWLEGWNLYGCRIAVGALAGQVNVVRFRNPSTSGVIAVISNYSISPGGGDNITVRYSYSQSVDLTNTATSAQGLDSRMGNSNSALARSFENNAAPALVGQPIGGWFWTGSNTINQDWALKDPQDEIPLLPGSVIDFIGGTVNIGWTFSARWRERAIEDSEKS